MFKQYKPIRANQLILKNSLSIYMHLPWPIVLYLVEMVLCAFKGLISIFLIFNLYHGGG